MVKHFSYQPACGGIRVRAILVLGLAGLIFSGCQNPFSSRKPEKPLGQTGSWEFPSTPNTVLKNLGLAYNEKILTNYETCFSSDFQFEVDYFLTGQFGSRTWNRDIELTTASKIYSTYTKYSDSIQYLVAIFPSADLPDDIQQDTIAILYRSYELLQMHSQSEPETTVVTGVATFHLRQENYSFWLITKWFDQHTNSTSPSWGDFKAQFR